MKKILSTTLATLGLASALTAAPTSFDFKDPKGVNAISFKLDAVLEPISGHATGVTGKVAFDPADPAATTGKLAVTTESLTVTNKMMTDHLHGDQWLDAKTNPEITFELTKLSNAKTAANVTTADAAGKLTIKGVTKDIKVPVKLTYIADGLEKRTKPGNKGDLLVVRADFTVLRADYGIQPGKNEDKVSSEIQLSVAVVGSAPKA